MSLWRFDHPMMISSDKTIMAARMVIGSIFSFALTTYFNFVDPTWVYISLFVVLFERDTIGASLMRGWMRGIATISSATFSYIIIICFHNNYLMNLLGFFLGTFLYTYVFLGTQESYIGALGSLTLAICLINFNDVSHIFIRPSNVIVGILIGLFTLRFFFPARATKLLLLNMQRFLTEYSRLCLELAHPESHGELSERLAQFELHLIPQIAHLKALLTEANVEVGKQTAYTDVVAEIIVCLRHIFRYFASIMAFIIYDKKELTEEDIVSLNHLHKTMQHLKSNLSKLTHQHRLLIDPNLIIANDEKTLPMMFRLIMIECQTLEKKINTLGSAAKHVRLN